jgi:6-phosphogluconate dehydrogenase (decarboxylating)
MNGSDFDGETFSSELDGTRLSSQLAAVKDLMSDGQWRSLQAIATEVGAPTASVSARLRDLRKPKFGGHDVQRRRPSFGGTHEYRLVPS